MPLYHDAAGQLVVRAAPIGGDVAVTGPATTNLVDTAPWFRNLDVNGTATGFHPATYYAGSWENPDLMKYLPGGNGNMCVNPNFELTTGNVFAHWGTSLGATTVCGFDLANWFPLGGHCGYFAQSSGTTTEVSYAFQGIPVSPGEWIEVSVYTGAHRCNIDIWIDWLDSTSTYISDSGHLDTNASSTSGGTSLSGYKRLWGKALAPSNTCVARFIISKSGTLSGSADSYAFFCQAYIGRTSSIQTVPSDYSSPRVILPDLWVKTLHIGDNQVTLPESAYNPNDVFLTGSLATYQTLAITPQTVQTKRVVQYGFNLYNITSSTKTVFYWLYKNGASVTGFSEILNVNASFGDRVQITQSYQYTAAANASDTFTINAYCGTAGNNVYMGDANIYANTSMK